MKNQILTILTLSMGLALVASLFNTCRTEKDNTYLSNKLLQAKVDKKQVYITKTIREVDTLIVTKEKTRIKYIHTTDSVRVLDSTEQANLFKLLYPNIDSANLMHYWYKHSQEQLALSDTIAKKRGSIVDSLKSVLIDKDSMLINANNATHKAENKATAWKWFGIIGWGLNLTH